MKLYPVNLKIAGRKCVVVGGGNVAERKIGVLLSCGAEVTVISPEFGRCIEELVERGAIRAVSRCFRSGDLEGAFLVIAATSDRETNEAVYREGHEAGALVNVVDVPDLCDFYVPARVTRGDLSIAIGTGGSFPALCKRLRKELEVQFGPEYADYLELLEACRKDIREALPDAARRREAEGALLEVPVLRLLAEGKAEEAAKALHECVERLSLIHI